MFQMQSIETPCQSMPKFSNTASNKSSSKNKSHSRTIRINNEDYPQYNYNYQDDQVSQPFAERRDR